MDSMTEGIDAVVSVHDHEDFAAKHLPNLGHDVKDFQVYTWRLTNWDELDKKTTSPEFDCGGHKWRILLFPFGNPSLSSSNVVSLYLDHAEHKESPKDWHTCAQLALVISNVHDPTIYTVFHAHHRFSAEASDWGFTRFSELRKLFNIQTGHSRPIIEEKSVDVTVYVRVLEDPTGVLWFEERPQLQAKRERTEESLFLTVRVITDNTFASHEGFDLATLDEKNWPLSDLPTFRVSKQSTYSDLKSRVVTYFVLPVDKVQLWVLVNRQNKTVRPDAPIPEDCPSHTVEMICNNMAATRKDLCLYLDVITGPCNLYPPPGHIILFLKHFDMSKQTLLGVGKVYVSRDSKVEELHPIINGHMRWTPGVPLSLYEEVKPGMIELMKPKLTFAQNDIQDGDVICFQVELASQELHDFELQGLYSNPIHFYGFLQNRVMIFFRPKHKKPSSNHPEFKLVLSKKHKYDTMCQRVGEYLQHDPMKLCFTTTHMANGAPKAMLQQSLNQSIEDIMGSSHGRTVILYEKLDHRRHHGARLTSR